MGSRVGGLNTASLPADKALAGVPRLLDDLQRLSEDTDSADIVFLLGRDEDRVYAHRVILMARCKSFQTAKRGEICRIPGCTVSPAAPGTPTPIRLPQVPPETFKQFLLYVYTGKILLQDSGVFEMMALAQELGVDELRNACEDHVTSTLSVSSACTFLATAMDIQDRSAGGKATAGFIERCVSYVGENATECIRTNSFLSLPKEAVIKLISSDYLCLDEEDVWRAVLNWAKYQAGVTQPTAHWTEEERARVCQQLSYVINHVRLLLIDSQVFAEEVEPTGAVPMELSLERYRHAALPSKYPEASEDQRLKPRVSPHLFPGSLLIGQNKSHFQRILNAWYGHPKQTWRLIYRASSHGYSASAFHRHCDGISPTYVIVLGARGEICGGFSDAAWARPPGKSRYIAADRAFLFTLHNHQELPPAQFHLVKKPFAICYHPESGPIFGAGADLLISSNCNSNMDSYSNLPHTYDGDGASSALLMGDYNFAVADYEHLFPRWPEYAQELYDMNRRPTPLDNEQCRSCSSFSDYIKSTKKKKLDENGNTVTGSGVKNNGKTQLEDDNTVKGRRTDCPLDKDELGNKSWGLLHTMAAKYPEQPSVSQKCDMRTFFNVFAKFYPCQHCAEDLREELKIEPPNVDSQEELSQWLCRLHNKVNVKVGKDVFDCSKVNERWRDGWLDGSCD